MLPKTHANPDLVAGESHRPHWNEPENRRHGFHNLHRIARYGQIYRAGSVLQLETAADLAIARRDDVARHCASPWFSAMVVARGSQLLFERHAADFPRDQPHSIMSISKTVMMLEIGRLWAAGKLGLEEKLGDILPWAGAGYARASVQDVLNMNVLNDYSEDYADPLCRVFEHEAATGMRLGGGPEMSSQQFMATIGLAPGASDCVNRTGVCMYRSANTDMLGAVAEVRGGRPLTAMLADLTDAAGYAGALHMACDRTGFAFVNGGISLTARDLARHGLLIARQGLGVNGQQVGSPEFIAHSDRRRPPARPARPSALFQPDQYQWPLAGSRRLWWAIHAGRHANRHGGSIPVGIGKRGRLRRRLLPANHRHAGGGVLRMRA